MRKDRDVFISSTLYILGIWVIIAEKVRKACSVVIYVDFVPIVHKKQGLSIIILL